MSVEVSTSDFRPLRGSPSARITGVHESLLQECEKDIIWYRENFFGKPHVNFLALESPRGPLAISIIQDGDVYKALVRSSTGSERLSILVTAVPNPWSRRLFGMSASMGAVMSAISRSIPLPNLRLCKDPGLPNALLAMEERQVIRSYKFGVAYLAPGQTSEEEMLANKMENTSTAFRHFLQFLGETLELKGWKGYRAGLDTSDAGNTGSHSVYTKWQGYEVMYHVAPLLPYTQGDRQQLERKRHIGNDIVVLVFQDSDSPFNLATITSKQNHVIAVVRPVGDGSYTFTIAPKIGVPAFSPELPEPCRIGTDAVSRDFFLHKLVNAERASYKAPSFAPKIQRTRSVLLYDVNSRFLS